MFGINWRITTVRRALIGVMLLGLCFTAVGCADRLEVQSETELVETVAPTPQPKIVEVSPPQGIQRLRQAFDKYQPQVRILSPQPDEVVQEQTVKVQLEVRGLPIFQNSQLDLGPHLEFILDNQPAIKVYDLNQPLVLKDLLPGTHTMRVFAARPWDESYKNQGAYAETTFHIYTRTEENNPDPEKPLLTYNLPKGVYGAEPIMLDFYLTNAPLHLVAQENPDDNIVDWRIRVTVNGSSFVVDRWEPIYLKGFDPGPNWVKLEFLDEQGNPVNNVFNNTARSLTYQPRGKDSLARLIRNELSSDEVRGLLNPKYEIPQPETVQPEVEVTPEEIPTEIPEPVTSEPMSDREMLDRVLDNEEAIEEVIPEETPAVEVTPEEIPAEIPEAVTSEPSSEEVSEEAIEEAIEEESPAVELVTPEETVEKTVPEETPEATTSTTETSESTESEKVNIREAIDRVSDRAVDVVNRTIDFVIDFVKDINIDIDIKLPWGGGETQPTTPPVVD